MIITWNIQLTASLITHLLQISKTSQIMIEAFPCLSLRRNEVRKIAGLPQIIMPVQVKTRVDALISESASFALPQLPCGHLRYATSQLPDRIYISTWT